MKRNRYRTIQTLLILFACAFTAVMVRIGAKGRGRTPGFARGIAAAEGTAEDPFARGRYEWMMTRDPKTFQIPRGIGARENAYVNRMRAQTAGDRVPVVSEWTSRGPVNIGGRTKALAIDLRDEDVILAGGVSSGMWKSVDGGKSWKKTTAPDQLHSVSCIAQTTAPGRENVWYYGTGEGAAIGRGGSASGPGGTDAFYRGDGVFKSTDNGETWAILPATVSGTATSTEPFDFVFRIVPFGENGVYAATAGGVFRSTDGGDNWSRVLGEGIDCSDWGESCMTSDIAVTRQGTVYAVLGGSSSLNGIYRSADGLAWDNITPPAFPDTTLRTVISVAQSNEKTVYFFTSKDNLETHLYKFSEDSGWTDLRGNLPWGGDLITYNAVMLVFDVKPDDENVLFLGAMGMYRSMDGGKSFEQVGAASSFHVDQHSIAFSPSDPKKMIVGNDGGLFRTDDNTAALMKDTQSGEYRLDWKSLNNGYLTTQFYTVALDHDTPGSMTIAGGMQDNGCWYADSADPSEPWEQMVWGDGGYVIMSDSGKTMYADVGAGFQIWKYTPGGLPLPYMEITPAAIGHAGGLWLPPMICDPHDPKIMYLPWRQQLWRNSDLTAIPFAFPPTPTDVNWARLENVNDHYITALGMSGALPKRLYYGGYGALFQLEDPQDGQPVPENVYGANMPFGLYLHCIAVDPRDANKLIVVFPNYGVISVYASEDGGGHWTPVAGNLEEHPDGSGDGPSVRWVSILYAEGQPVYFAGTSVGLFSTTKLDSMKTNWVQEGAETIGNVVVDMVDVRQSDGFVVVGTHGNGVYTATVTEIPSAVRTAAGPPVSWDLSPVYPNPFNSEATIRFTLSSAGTVNLTVFNLFGERVATLADGRLQAGEHRIRWNAGDRAAGTYLIRLSTAGRSQTRKVVLLK
jgi:hypothetical protein